MASSLPVQTPLFGNGLIEIAALTALVGSSTTEELTLGNRGAPGLVWAGMSTFGCLSMVKACAAAGAPGWLRDTLGVRSAATDSALGVSLDLSSPSMNREDRARKNIGEAKGVVSEPGSDLDADVSETVATGVWRDIYAFENFMQTPLSGIPPSPPTNPVIVHMFSYDPRYKGPLKRWDWIGLLVSTIKLSEFFTLWAMGARTLCWITCITWLYFFSFATLILLMGISRGYKQKISGGRSDILAGQLPTPLRPGGERKLLLGAPRNFRCHTLWNVMWRMGWLVCSSSLLASYVILGQQIPMVTYVWLAFQLIWLLLRLIFFHLAEGANSINYPVLSLGTPAQVPRETRARVLNLMVALAKYQEFVHPRGAYSYSEQNLRSLEQVKLLLHCSISNTTPAIPSELINRNVKNIEVEFIAVIGDNIISSAAWLHGSTLGGLDLYDCCIVTIAIRRVYSEERKVFSIPAARALSKKDPQSPVQASFDVEKIGNPITTPRGGVNMGPDTVCWTYWIPCSDGKWLHAFSQDLKILGKQRLRAMTDDEVTDMLRGGKLNIDLRSVEDIRRVVKNSQEGSRMLLALCGGSDPIVIKDIGDKE